MGTALLLGVPPIVLHGHKCVLGPTTRIHLRPAAGGPVGVAWRVRQVSYRLSPQQRLQTRQDRIRDWIDRPPSLDNVGAQYAKMRVLPMTKCKPLSHSFNHTPPYIRAATAATRSLTATWDRRNHRALRYKCDDQTAIKRLLDSRHLSLATKQCLWSVQPTSAPVPI